MSITMEVCGAKITPKENCFISVCVINLLAHCLPDTYIYTICEDTRKKCDTIIHFFFN